MLTSFTNNKKTVQYKTQRFFLLLYFYGFQYDTFSFVQINEKIYQMWGNDFIGYNELNNPSTTETLHCSPAKASWILKFRKEQRMIPNNNIQLVLKSH